MKTHVILYVQDQQAATHFYASVLKLDPILNVPGMTEFQLNHGCVLGLMPEKGIKRLLGDKLPDPAQANGVPRVELYVIVDDPEVYYRRALEYGARELSAVAPRDWGNRVGYSIDRDGHVVAFSDSVVATAKPSNFRLDINDSYFLSDITATDKAAYIEHLKEKQIYDQTLEIPFPYTEADADWWINNVAETMAKQGRSVNWAIRRTDGHLIGGIGFHDFELGKSHKAELGYWLAKPYWSKGIMTSAVKVVTAFGFREFGLERITANVFDFNAGSARVLEKAGYKLEGHLRKHYKKDGKIFDGKLYAITKEDV